MSFNPRSPLYKLTEKNPLPARPSKDRGVMGPLPLGDPPFEQGKSAMDVARDGYQSVPRDGTRPAYEQGERYDADNPYWFGRFT